MSVSVRVESEPSSPRLWRNSGTSQHSGRAHLPDPGLPPDPEASGIDRKRPLILRIGKKLRRMFDRLIASSSLVPNDPVLDVRDFPWTAMLRAHWRDIRDEAIGVALARGAAPPLATISPDHRRIAAPDKWRSFFLYGYGYPIEENLARCPKTAALVSQIPDLNSAFFSILAPGTHIPEHRGVTKALITCHLGLIVPRDGDVRMRLADRIVRWAEGETLVFDDTYRHEIRNDTTGTRVVLLLQVGRPLRQPGKWIADLFLGGIRRSAFVQDARVNVRRWNDAIRQLDI